MELLLLLLFLLFVLLVCGIGFFISQRRQAAIRDSIVPGNYVFKNDVDNPFRTEYDYAKVHEVKNGWVKYTFTLNDDVSALSMRSKRVEAFAELYIHYPFDKD